MLNNCSSPQSHSSGSAQDVPIFRSHSKAGASVQPSKRNRSEGRFPGEKKRRAELMIQESNRVPAIRGRRSLSESESGSGDDDEVRRIRRRAELVDSSSDDQTCGSRGNGAPKTCRNSGDDDLNGSYGNEDLYSLSNYRDGDEDGDSDDNFPNNAEEEELTFEEREALRQNGSSDHPSLLKHRSSSNHTGARKNKNTPLAMSSKRPVKRFREVVPVPKKNFKGILA
jgi:hypothetical protein